MASMSSLQQIASIPCAETNSSVLTTELLRHSFTGRPKGSATMAGRKRPMGAGRKLLAMLLALSTKSLA
eukprot:11511159-Heterocapsa_arctica.AAC.1